MLRVLQIIQSMTRWERLILAALSCFVILSFAGLLRMFYVQNTVLIPAMGGTYIEGSVGELQPLNPWFTVQNDVNRDIVSLVFSGLLRYNPQSKKIEDDLATMQVSPDNRIYTLRLKDNIFWHDSTQSSPHPVTADDVVFTFTTIQDPQFPNTLLQQNFRGVTVDKIDDRTVRFKLDEAYSFFSSNLTLGLLPKRSFEGIPVSKLDMATDFGFRPVGSGPYKMKTIVQTELSSEVTLERFDRTLPPPHRLDRVVFRIFSDYSSLLSDLRNLHGVRLVPHNDKGEPMVPKRFVASKYYLPQYVALFLNLDRRSLQDEKLRLGLQLGTNKMLLANTIKESILVDTPLLEIDMSDWRYHFDSDAAQGALFSSKWNLPEKIRLQHLLEQEEANRLGVLKVSPVILLETGAVFTITGSLVDIKDGYKLNGVALQKNPAATGSWIAALPIGRGATGALVIGENLVRLTDAKDNIVDSCYVRRTRNKNEYRRAMEEQRLVQQFINSRSSQVPTAQRISIQNLYSDDGMLRLRTPADPVSVRRNEKGEQLVLQLLTSPSPPDYRKVAEFIQQQWAVLGVKVTINIPETRDEFQDRLLRRDYDIVLFGQSLLDNLDSYPYWHSGGVQKLTGDAKNLRKDAYNLSQYTSFRADALLETVRRTTNEKERSQALKELRDVLKNDVPAIFLFSPYYTFAHHQNVRGIELGSLSLHSDRFLTLNKWYVKRDRVFKPGKGWLSFFGWLPTLIGASANES